MRLSPAAFSLHSCSWKENAAGEGRASASVLDPHAEALQSLVERTIAVTGGTEIQARELATIVHGVAKSGYRSGDGFDELMSALAKAILPRVQDCTAQHLANIAWAFAKCGRFDGALFSKIGSFVAENSLVLESFKASAPLVNPRVSK